jgi:ribosome biogenesis protein BRX1
MGKRTKPTEDEDGEGSEGQPTSTYPSVIRRATHTKKKVLVLASRGVTSAYMELMEDLMKLMPHSRKDPKFDKKEPLSSIVEIAELAACKLCLYFETRKMKDLYLWAGSVKHGPSAKFLVQQVRPMRDLRLTGNCLLGSRPILSFDGGFDSSPHLAVVKGLLTQIFQPPKGHPRSKPFHDHVLSFSALEGRILVRHYQLVPADEAVRGSGPSLVEIGPRFALVPIRVLDGCFSGESLFANDAYVSPNVQRAEQKRKRAKSTVGHVIQKEKRRKRIQVDGADTLPEDDLEDVFT